MSLANALSISQGGLPGFSGVQGSHAAKSDFLATMNQALSGISQNQALANNAEQAVASGAAGASMSSALVLSDRAEIGFNATVAVRNELVSAYQTVMNMQI
jgi:flagellar hook-basal body complex protein FliE